MGICTQSQEYGASGENSRPHAGLVEVAPRFSGRGPAAPARGWAFSSVGESARLITVRSLVRIQKGPRPRLLRRAGRDRPGRHWQHGDVAQLGEHLLCKQGVGGSSPPISRATPPAAAGPRARPQNLHIRNSLRECRSPYTFGGSPRRNVNMTETASERTPRAKHHARTPAAATPQGVGHGWRAPPCSVVEQ